LSHHIEKLNPNYFWLGGGEVDLKLAVDTKQFIKSMNPIIADITVDKEDPIDL
jgi:hypothetical protein